MTIKERLLDKLLSRKFIISIMILTVGTIGLFSAVIGDTSFVALAGSVLALYSAGSVLEGRKDNKRLEILSGVENKREASREDGEA